MLILLQKMKEWNEKFLLYILQFLLQIRKLNS